MSALLEMRDSLVHWLENAHPVAVFAAMVVLPLFCFPVSVLWIGAGVRFGIPLGIALSILALTLNMSIAYVLGRWFLRRFAERLVRHYQKKLPTMGSTDQRRLIILLRITPGVPLCVQNYVLGLAAVEFRRYLLWSVALQSIFLVVFVAFGESAMRGSGGRIALAICGLVAAVVLVGLVRRRYRQRQAAALESTGEAH